MAEVVEKARKKLSFLLIGIITPGGIGLLVLYNKILIPAINMTIIIWALAVAIPPVIGMIAFHDLVLMKRRWNMASAFLDHGEESGVTAREALTAILDFPVKMPAFGLLIWVVGGFLAAVGAYLGTSGRVRFVDAGSMWLGIASASVIITVFQIFYWRRVLDPVAGQIIHKAPDVLDEDFNVFRPDLRWVLSVALIPLITVSLLMAVLAGYRQASTALQNMVGKDHLKVLNQEWNDRLSMLDNESDMVAELRAMENEHKFENAEAYLVRIEPGTKKKSATYTELLRGVNYYTIVPPVALEIVEKELGNSADGGYLFDLFNEEITAGRKIRLYGQDYYLLMGYPWSNYSGQLNNFKWISALLMAVVIGFGAFVVRVIAREIATPVAKLVEFAQEVGEGKIHRDVFYYANDEVGDLALSLREMSSRLGEVLNQIREAAGSLDQATGSIRHSSVSVKEGAKLQQEAIEDVASSMTEMDMTIQGIADNVEVLSTSAEESSSSIFEMSAAVKKINESVDILNQSINEVSSSINEMTAALDQVADNVSNLSAVSEETAASMAEMDASIRAVEKNTKDTADWSQSVIQDAETGVETVYRVTKEMHEISDVVHSGQQVIERLGSRVDEIGKIVKVIDDVANQTNLLALNAAIIAAQAGEHGRGFAVVADEIKQLAERTSGSTREIHQLIRGVQEESHQAVGAIEEGTRAVEEGVKLAEQASGSLAKIMDSTKLSIDRVQGIARTTKEQAESSRQVSKAIDRMAEMVSQISVATQQQSRGSALILKATEEMKSASLQVKRNAEEQLQGSKLITKSIENITDMLYSINQSQQDQKKSSSHVIQLMERIKVVSHKSTDSARQLIEVVDALSSEGEKLKAETRKFQLLSNGNGYKTNDR